MKQYCQVRISSKLLDAAALARKVESFASNSVDWELPEAQSAEYEKMCGQPSCCIISKYTAFPCAAVHLSLIKAKTLTVTNIVPIETNQLTIGEYNSIASMFARLVKKEAFSEKLPIKVIISKDTLTLDELITGKICKKLFFSYINAYPLSYHPSDIGKLDKFICALFRFARKSFDLDALEYLLQEELNWPKNDAKWCRNRIEIGLDILAVNKRF